MTLSLFIKINGTYTKKIKNQSLVRCIFRWTCPFPNLSLKTRIVNIFWNIKSFVKMYVLD